MLHPSSSNPTSEVVNLPVFKVENYEKWGKDKKLEDMSTSQELWHNYGKWSEYMEETLTSLKLWDIVQNCYERPIDAIELANWKNNKKNEYRKNQNEKDAEALMLIQQAVGVEIMAKVFASDTYKKIYKKNITAKLRSSDQKNKAQEAIDEVLSVPREVELVAISGPLMVELVATSCDVWETLKTTFQSPNQKETQKTTFENLNTNYRAMSHLELEEITRSSLFQLAMRGDWNKVIEIYTRKSVAHCAKITYSGDTALHIAVIDGKEQVVEKLVKLMSLEEAKEALRVQNERGNTPLHLAASVGNAKLCYYIAGKVYLDDKVQNSSGNKEDKSNDHNPLEKKKATEKDQNSVNKEVKNDQNTSKEKEAEKKDQKSKTVEFKNQKSREIEIEAEKDYKNSSKEKETDKDQNSSEKIEDVDLLGERNKEEETPMFLAAFLGKTDAFLCLQYYAELSNRSHHSPYYRGKNGDTILHVAISGEHFDLAFQIIHLYPELADSVNEGGIYPLHVLASKPTAFRSGVHLRPHDKLIYKCTVVDPLKVKKVMHPGSTNPTSQNGNNDRCPENYETCFRFFSYLCRVIIAIVGIPRLRRQVKSGEILPTISPTATPASPDTNNSLNPVIKNSSSWLKRTFEAGKEANLGSTRGNGLVPPNYGTPFELLKLGWKAMLVVLGLGSRKIRKIKLKKEKHTWSVQVFDKLLDKVSLMYKYDGSGGSGASPGPGGRPQLPDEGGKTGDQPKLPSKIEKPETALLKAAMNGIPEIMEKILHKFPFSIHDINSHKRNVVLLAVQNRQPHVYKLLLKRRKKNVTLDKIFREVDDEGNSAMHLAASTIGDYKPWRIPGAALQMQWEIKWYKYVENSMPQNFFPLLNYKNESAKEIFSKSHQELVRSGGEWLTNTSQSCSVVAALIATVAFTTSATVPGGNVEETGTPVLQNQAAFKVFAISSLVALCFSVTSVIMFLAILTSRYEAKDFGEDLPVKVLFGLTSLFVSIAAILVCFCAGHFFVLSDELKYAAFPVYGLTCLPVAFFALAQFPLYLDLVRATFATVPQRSYNMAVAGEKDDKSSLKSEDPNQPKNHKSSRIEEIEASLQQNNQLEITNKLLRIEEKIQALKA